MEKHYEHNQDMYMLFVDFKQAFDSIDRYKLYKVMEDMKIPYKLITLVKTTMKNTTASVKVTNKLSNSFTFNAGVKQGNGLSTTLFILALHYGVQKIDKGVQSSQNLAKYVHTLTTLCSSQGHTHTKKTNRNVPGLRRGKE